MEVIYLSLINCPECGSTISSEAKCCPNCAFPISKESTNRKEETKRFSFISRIKDSTFFKNHSKQICVTIIILGIILSIIGISRVAGPGYRDLIIERAHAIGDYRDASEVNDDALYYPSLYSATSELKSYFSERLDSINGKITARKVEAGVLIPFGLLMSAYAIITLEKSNKNENKKRTETIEIQATNQGDHQGNDIK